MDIWAKPCESSFVYWYPECILYDFRLKNAPWVSPEMDYLLNVIIFWNIWFQLPGWWNIPHSDQSKCSIALSAKSNTSSFLSFMYFLMSEFRFKCSFSSWKSFRAVCRRSFTLFALTYWVLLSGAVLFPSLGLIPFTFTIWTTGTSTHLLYVITVSFLSPFMPSLMLDNRASSGSSSPWREALRLIKMSSAMSMSLLDLRLCWTIRQFSQSSHLHVPWESKLGLSTCVGQYLQKEEYEQETWGCSVKKHSYKTTLKCSANLLSGTPSLLEQAFVYGKGSLFNSANSQTSFASCGSFVSSARRAWWKFTPSKFLVFRSVP